MSKALFYSKKLTILFVCVSTFLTSIGQSKCELLNNYSLAVCKRDTATALKNLESFKSSFPNDSLIEEINLRIIGIYFGKGEFEKSKKIAWGIISKKRNPHLGVDKKCINVYDSSICRQQIYVSKDLREIQHKASINLYEISMKERKYDSALYYLKLADTDFSSSLWCFYFPSNWRNNILRNYASVYENMGQIDKAIDLLATHIISDKISDKLIYLLQKYKNIQSIQKNFQHIEDSIVIEYGIVSEYPKVTYEYDENKVKILRTISINEYGRIAKWHFLGHKFFVAKTNDFIANKVKGQRKKRKLEATKSNEELIKSAKEFIQRLEIYQYLNSFKVEIVQ